METKTAVADEVKDALREASDNLSKLVKLRDKLSGSGLEKTVARYRERMVEKRKGLAEEIDKAMETLLRLKSAAKK